MELTNVERILRPKYFGELKSRRNRRVGLSPITYFETFPLIDDDYLSEWEVYKSKALFTEKFDQSIIFPALSAGVCWYTVPYLLGYGADMKRQKYKATRILFTMSMTGVFYLYTQLWAFPSRTFHDLITQPEPRGKYIRSFFKDQVPNNWSKISKDLHSMGYNFKEMNEYSLKTDMPDTTTKYDDKLY